MKKLFDSSINIRVRIFNVMGLVATIGNTLGFTANSILYGFSGPTIFCGVCALAVFFLTIFGMRSKSIRIPTYLMIFLFNVLEFPFLYYVYGRSTFVYMILGLFTATAFLVGYARYLCVGTIVIYDIAIIVLSHLYPSHIEKITTDNSVGSAVCSYVIVSIAIFAVTVLLILQYERLTAELFDANEKLTDLSNLDPLTDVYNRRYLLNYIHSKMTKSEDSFSIILMDLDDFKNVNDTYGHVFGDEVLMNFCIISKEIVGDHGIVARFGGEEFMIVYNSTNREEISALLKTIRERFLAFSISSRQAYLTFSAGVECYHTVDNINQLFNSVDRKLYTAKNAGKDQAVF